MRRSAIRTFTGLFALGVATLFLTGARDEHALAFTLGVTPTAAVADLRPGHELCQRPVDVPAGFHRLTMSTAGPVAAAPAIDITVKSVPAGRVLAEGTTGTGGGLLDGVVVAKVVTAEVGGVPKGRRVAVCLTTKGPRPALLYGNAAAAARGSSAYLDGRRLPADLSLVFERDHPATLLSLAPDIVLRASLFHGFLSAPWLLWLIAGLLVTALPILLVVALAGVARGEDQEAG